MGFNYKCDCRISGREFYLCDEHKNYVFNLLEIEENKSKVDDMNLRDRQNLLSQVIEVRRFNYGIFINTSNFQDKLKKMIYKQVQEMENGDFQ